MDWIDLIQGILVEIIGTIAADELQSLIQQLIQGGDIAEAFAGYPGGIEGLIDVLVKNGIDVDALGAADWEALGQELLAILVRPPGVSAA